MPQTALKHFNEDIKRAKDILAHAKGMGSTTPAMLRADLFRSAWMFGVGALDAYFCDAYTDVLARLLRAKERQGEVPVPALSKVSIPIEVVLDKRAKNHAWKWRMGIRGMMSDRNVLDLDEAKGYLNKLVAGPKLVDAELIRQWSAQPGSKRWLGDLPSINAHDTALKSAAVKRAELDTLKASGAATTLVTAAANQLKSLNAAAKAAQPHYPGIESNLKGHFDMICDRRHQCIHNCDRPKQAPQKISDASAQKALDDIDWLITCIDAWLETGFRQYIINLGFDSVTRNKIGCS